MDRTTGRRALAQRLQLANLPTEVLQRIVACIDVLGDLAALNATSRLFRGAPGSSDGSSVVESLLRARAAARGHARALPVTLPSGAYSWTEELFRRERVLGVARRHASAVAAGGHIDLRFSAFVDPQGGVHTCGECMPLGEGYSLRVSHVALSQPELLWRPVLLPTRVASLASVRVCAVSAGHQHLLALTESGAVHACGINDRGQLGLGDMSARAAMEIVAALADEVVICISAGYTHSVAVTARGTVYSWGSNGRGQLGLGKCKLQIEPCIVNSLDGVSIAAASAGLWHTLLLSARGAVYSCGDGGYGQLGHANTKHRSTPRRIQALASLRAVHVSAGFYHSLVVDAAGDVHSFGQGLSGPLGHGDSFDEHTPKRIAVLAGRPVVRAYAGSHNSAVVCADGSAYTFGGNVCDLGSITEWHAIPRRENVKSAKPVVDCAISSCHALYVTADGAVHSYGKQSGALGHGASAAQQQPSVELPTRIEGLAAAADI